MSDRLWSARSHDLLNSASRGLWGLLCMACLLTSAQAQERREREHNSVYAESRAKLAAQVDGPIVLWGYTGREEVSQTYIFEQEENFYYLTGHNEEGAGLIILPASQKREVPNISRDILFLPAKNPQKEKWNGFRLSPSDAGIEGRTGFVDVKPFESDFRIAVERLAKTVPNFYTILPYQKELGGYPHEKSVVDWLQLAAPPAKLKDIRGQIGALRQIKSPGELAYLKEAIDLSLDAHFEAMKLMRPGLYEYQGAAKMVEVHAWGGFDGSVGLPFGAAPGVDFDHFCSHLVFVEPRAHQLHGLEMGVEGQVNRLFEVGEFARRFDLAQGADLPADVFQLGWRRSELQPIDNAFFVRVPSKFLLVRKNCVKVRKRLRKTFNRDAEIALEGFHVNKSGAPFDAGIRR